jgi:kynureninase
MGHTMREISAMNYENTLAFARRLDEEDPLKHFRQKFYIPQHRGEDCIYFTGNSLGLQPKSLKGYINRELDSWAEFGVEGHFKGERPWLSYHELFPQQISNLVGALPDEVVVMNQLTVNLHLLLTTFYRPTKQRYKIICERMAFPSDHYALETQAKLHGFNPNDAVIQIGTREGEQNIRLEDILTVIDRHKNELALVLFGGVNYYSGQVMDMKSITAAAHNAGAYAGFDLAHAIGNIQMNLHDWNVDFACWCSYKYLNSGPGGVAGVYIHEQHATNTSLPRMGGWWGHSKEERFLMKPGFQPIATSEGWQLSNAPVLSMAAHKAALDIFEEAGMEALTEKSKRLTGYLFFVLDEINKKHSEKWIDVITPRNENEHGCQVSMLMQHRGKDIFNLLLEAGVIADWREPNVIRIAPVPLYNTFEDVWRFGNIIESMK